VRVGSLRSGSSVSVTGTVLGASGIEAGAVAGGAPGVGMGRALISLRVCTLGGALGSASDLPAALVLR